ncbi:uncharacterized protein FIBRA_06142 [Fibroporia radiculosa]|uniref:Uncharacterized protein n=1 Tax=Fibroporia radiculosa TaxID=599839 RepID=J4IB38_9APHY|nr:uncharacterized protein FIBRA_06142 [Fibroporia radiculosa]CCM03986.1 predicted protein [Fibroporia radiculosa]
MNDVPSSSHMPRRNPFYVVVTPKKKPEPLPGNDRAPVETITGPSGGPEDSPSWTVLETATEPEAEPELEDELEATVVDHTPATTSPTSNALDYQMPLFSTLSNVLPERSDDLRVGLSSFSSNVDDGPGTTSGLSSQQSRGSSGAILQRIDNQGELRPRKAFAFDGVVLPSLTRRQRRATVYGKDKANQDDETRNAGTYVPQNLVQALAFAFAHNDDVGRDHQTGKPPKAISEHLPIAPTHIARPDAANVKAQVPRTLHQVITLNEKSGAEIWETVDDLLGTVKAPAVLDTSALSATLEGEARFSRKMQLALPTIATNSMIEGNKRWKAYAVPRWSRVAIFKERLDASLGLGDFNRGLGKRPIEDQREEEEASSVPQDDVAAEVTNLKRRRSAASPELEASAVLTDSSETPMEMNIQMIKRRRLDRRPDPPASEGQHPD